MEFSFRACLQGGLSTEVNIKAEGCGKPMNFVLTSGERHEAIAFLELVKGGKVKCEERGRPKQRACFANAVGMSQVFILNSGWLSWING